MTENVQKSQSARRPRPVRIVRMVLLALAGMAVAAFFALLFAILVKVLWNWLMPVLFGLPVIGFWQAFGILLLAKILFGGHGGRGTEHDHKSGHVHRWFHRSSDGPGSLQREAWLGGFDCRTRDHFNEFWAAEGRGAFADFLARKRGGEPAAQSEE